MNKHVVSAECACSMCSQCDYEDCACTCHLPDFADPDVEEQDESDFCPHCGKEYTEFSDAGCEYCDARLAGGGL